MRTRPPQVKPGGAAGPALRLLMPYFGVTFGETDMGQPVAYA